MNKLQENMDQGKTIIPRVRMMEVVMRALKNETNGMSLEELLKFVTNEKQVESRKTLPRLMDTLKRAKDRGLIEELPNKKYTILKKEGDVTMSCCPKRRRSRKRNACKKRKSRRRRSKCKKRRSRSRRKKCKPKRRRRSRCKPKRRRRSRCKPKRRRRSRCKPKRRRRSRCKPKRRTRSRCKPKRRRSRKRCGKKRRSKRRKCTKSCIRRCDNIENQDHIETVIELNRAD